MKPVKNIIATLLAGDKTTNEALLVLHATIGALVTQTISSAQTHVRNPQPVRQDTTSAGYLNLQALKDKYNNTLDARNELDAANRVYDSTGMTEPERMTEDAGYDTPMPPLHVAGICFGIAKDLYVDMLRIDGSLDVRPDALLFEPKHPPLVINYNQPQSAEGNLNYRVSLTPEARPEEVTRLKEMGEDEKMAREMLTKQAINSRARLLHDRNAIMTEIAGLDGQYNISDFVALPSETQLSIVRRIAEKLAQRRLNLRTQGMRGNTEAAQDATLIDAHCKALNAWLHEHDRVVIRAAA